MMEEEGKNWVFVGRDQTQPCHYKHGPCQASGVLWFWQGLGWHGRAKLLASQAQISFSPFS